MNFSNANADIFVPDGTPVMDAFRRTTHLCIGAHQDDVEILASHGILECFGHTDKWFTGVVVTDGAGSPRTGIYQCHSDQEMREIRRREQRKAAFLGEYSIQVQLSHSSEKVKDGRNSEVVDDLAAIFALAHPGVVYLHNPADKHDTHVAVLLRSLAALRKLPKQKRPTKVYGCEVWRSLDWLVDSEKVLLPVTGHQAIASALVGVFDSQISGGKRYDSAAAGRRLANATFFASHDTDNSEALGFAIDLTPLVHDDKLTLESLALAAIDHFRQDVTERLRKLGP